jgi:hypothetical protein
MSITMVVKLPFNRFSSWVKLMLSLITQNMPNEINANPTGPKVLISPNPE